MFFSAYQIEEIIKTIEQTHWLFIANFINPNLVSKEVMKDLKKIGFDEKQILSYPHLAMQFGMLSISLKDKEVRSLSFEKLKKYIKAKKILPLSSAEKFALETVERRAMNDITGLGNKVSNNFRTILIEADARQRSEYEKIIKNVALSAIKKRESIKFIRSEIGHKTNDWARDLDRIADYILHEAYDTGRAYEIKKQKGDNALVFKRVHKDACKHCQRLYLKNLKTWEPKIFKLRDLFNNGTNIGLNVKDWKPVIGAAHPWCRCDLEYIPEGFIWSDKTQRFIVVQNKNKYDLKKKIKIIKN